MLPVLFLSLLLPLLVWALFEDSPFCLSVFLPSLLSLRPITNTKVSPASLMMWTASSTLVGALLLIAITLSCPTSPHFSASPPATTLGKWDVCDEITWL